MTRVEFEWTPERVDTALSLKAKGLSAREIGLAIGATNRSVLAKFRRLADLVSWRALGRDRINRSGHATDDDSAYIKPHKYRTPRRIDMGPIVRAARAAVAARRAGNGP